MERFESFGLGDYRGDTYLLVGFVEPDPHEYDEFDPAEDAVNYGWTLVQKAESPLDKNVEIARMDTRHGQPHLDKEYLPRGTNEEKKMFLEDGYSFERMRDYLLENWQKFADLHIHYNE